MELADAIALSFVCFLLILIMNSVFIMLFTKKIDKYWSISPNYESDFLYFQFCRFHRYGYYILIKKWSLKPVPTIIKTWVSCSFVANLLTISAAIIGWIFIKYYQ